MKNKESVIIVDHDNKKIGDCEKLEAHKKGLLHRAFSIFLISTENKLLLQQRAKTKYHSGELWSNTVCGHPRMGEEIMEGAKRRLFEEMGIQTELNIAFDFIYWAEVGQGLIEHEFDYVLIGRFNGTPSINPEEVQDWKYVSFGEIEKDLKSNGSCYTPWFKIAFPKVRKYLNNNP